MQFHLCPHLHDSNYTYWSHLTPFLQASFKYHISIDGQTGTNSSESLFKVLLHKGNTSVGLTCGEETDT